MLPAWTAVHEGFTDGELKRLYPSMLSSKPPDSSEKSSDFTSRHSGVARLPLLSLFVLLCCFGVLTC